MEQIAGCIFLYALTVFIGGCIGFARDVTKGMDDM